MHAHTHAQAAFSSFGCMQFNPLPFSPHFCICTPLQGGELAEDISVALSLLSSLGTDTVQHLRKPRALWHLQGFSSGKQLSI